MFEQDDLRTFNAPELPYLPPKPKSYHPKIGVIGCGGVTQWQFTAYKQSEFNIVALCDSDESRALARQKEYYPDAKVYTDYRDLLKRDDIEVLDITTHPLERVQIIEDALRAHKHVLSQKPFVLDLDTGHRLVDLAEKTNCKLAVNQNGRWSPHFSYLRQLVANDYLGDMMAANLIVSFNHNWTAGTPFDNIRHLLLYDFAIHWFDILTQFLPGNKPQQVFAAIRHAPQQKSKPALLGQAMIEFESAQATLVFDGSTTQGLYDMNYLVGTKGSAFSEGPNLNHQWITLCTAEGTAKPDLTGRWFIQGFQGTLAELICSIEDKRTPNNNARENLTSLALCFAAIASAETGLPQVPGEIRTPPLNGK